ncbi:MAG: hypothetical protein IJX07_06170 [Bacillales bacterium]|nr:hypothetical protein [Bacillales bacterium]
MDYEECNECGVSLNDEFYECSSLGYVANVFCSEKCFIEFCKCVGILNIVNTGVDENEFI